MHNLDFRKLSLVIGIISVYIGILACQIPGMVEKPTKPTVVVDSPPSGTQVKVGEEVEVDSTATDEKGVTRVELWVDGALVRSDQSPTPQPAFSLVQRWTPPGSGSHTVEVRAYNVDGVVSEPAMITLRVEAATLEVTPALTEHVTGPGEPTAELTEEPASEVRPTLVENVTGPGESAAEPTEGPAQELTASREGEICSGGDRVVALLVDPTLVDDIRAGLDQFERDLCEDGYTIVERHSGLTSPPDIRGYLADLYLQTGQRLVGAILIGGLPHAYQWFTVTYANPNISPSSREVISFQYYADLDGVFAASPDYASPSGRPYSYDVHSGDMDWEIWIGVLPLYRGDSTSTVEALERYFAKNHAYRTGGYDLPRAFLQIHEHSTATTAEEHNQILEGLRSGEYAWTPFSDASNAHIYFNSPPVGLSVEQGYAALSDGVADLTVVEAHGTPSGSGRMDIAWVESNPVRTVFFLDLACSAGNLDYAENFLTSVLYSPTSMVLVAEGTTSESGGMGTNENGFFGHNIATVLSRGESFGRAILSHVNVPLRHPWSENREEHFAEQVILGDPTLGLQP
jgi:hypothetical protein